MKKEKIEELLILATQKCGHCLHWRFTHYDQGECERYQIPNTHKDDGGICNGFKIGVYRVQLGIVEFTQAINQAELEWYKKLEKKISEIRYGDLLHIEMTDEQIEKLWNEYAVEEFDDEYYETVKEFTVKSLSNVLLKQKLEWCQELYTRLNIILDVHTPTYELVRLRDEIRNKIKELENGNQ